MKISMVHAQQQQHELKIDTYFHIFVVLSFFTTVNYFVQKNFEVLAS